MSDKHLGKRTNGEAAWLHRMRHNKTQAEMAAELGMSERNYRRFESGEIDVPHDPICYRPTLGELCALARRRHGLGLRATARAVGCAHVTLLAKEDRSDADLVAYWRGHGYRFPAEAEK